MSYLIQPIKMNVENLLDLPFASEFKLLAGEAGLHNIVSGGNIMDNPNALDWFAPEVGIDHFRILFNYRPSYPTRTFKNV